jgi:hypothetical protein
MENSDPGWKNSDPVWKNSDPGWKKVESEIRGWKKVGSWIRDNHPGSATLICAVQVVLSMKRRATMAPLVSRVWKWFEISSGKWCPYGPQQNKAIDQAFWAGEQSLKITSGRRKYNIQVSHHVFSQRERRIRMFLGLLDPDPLVRGTDPDPDPSIIKQK